MIDIVWMFWILNDFVHVETQYLYTYHLEFSLEILCSGMLNQHYLVNYGLSVQGIWLLSLLQIHGVIHSRRLVRCLMIVRNNLYLMI